MSEKAKALADELCDELSISGFVAGAVYEIVEKHYPPMVWIPGLPPRPGAYWLRNFISGVSVVTLMDINESCLTFVLSDAHCPIPEVEGD